MEAPKVKTFFNILNLDCYLAVGIKKHTVLLYEQFYIILKQLGFLFVKVLVPPILPVSNFNTFFLHRTTMNY